MILPLDRNSTLVPKVPYLVCPDTTPEEARVVEWTVSSSGMAQ